MEADRKILLNELDRNILLDYIYFLEDFIIYNTNINSRDYIYTSFILSNYKDLF